MKTFKELLKEATGGEEAGKLEIVKTDIKEARSFAEEVFSKNGFSLDEEIPNFDKNYMYAKNLAKLGTTKRHDMPVIDTADVKDLQHRLQNGYIDIKEPVSHDKISDEPFPEGLHDRDAKLWLQNGLKVHDGDKEDDVVKVKLKSISVGDLKPIQKQIYFDKSITSTAEFGSKGTSDFLQNKSIFIASEDNYIIDGHHRFLSGVLIDPKMKVKVLSIDLPINVLLPLSLSYGDSVGNKRNS